MKEQKRKEEWDSIVKSNNYQISERERIKREQLEKDKEFTKLWRKQNEAIQVLILYFLATRISRKS